MESLELISTPMELPDDDFAQKVINRIGVGLNWVCIVFRSSQIAELKDDAINLYSRYMGVFSEKLA